MKCNLPSIGWVKKALSKLGIVSDFAYCSYKSSPNLKLTSTYQKLTVFEELIPPVNISELNGDFTALSYGIFEWHLERIYQNTDQNPSELPIQLYIEVRRNGIAAVDIDAPIGTATNPNEPVPAEFSTPFIFKVEKGDIFNFWFKSEDGIGVDPLNIRLVRVQIIANKIHNR